MRRECMCVRASGLCARLAEGIARMVCGSESAEVTVIRLCVSSMCVHGNKD